jgi:vacuolar protein sorting-associated protein 13A/C
MGVKALGVGFREGATGVLSKPLQGAMDDGARGFVKGLGRGLLGVAAKPISGVASLVSKTAEGIAADAKDLTARGRRAAALRTRVRQPRLIGPDGVLLPYPKPLLSNTEEDGGEDKEGGKEKGKE